MNPEKNSNKNRPEVTLDSLYRIFTIPENHNSTLAKIEGEISKNLNGFLKDHIVAEQTNPSVLEKDFLSSEIPEEPIFVSEQAEFLLTKVVARSVHTSSPSFVGHMTSALPYFMMPLAKIMIALNQNLVKTETSKAFTPLERQVISMLHRLVYDKADEFYDSYSHSASHALGALCSNGTIANITSLWVALNRLLPKNEQFEGVGDEGLFRAVAHYGYKDLAILVSKRGHYSLSKAANLLGIGRKNLIAIDTKENNKIDLDRLSAKITELKEQNIGIVAVVGIAGTTETGNIDPLEELAEICKVHNLHFHVDAAWGGPTLFSNKYKYRLKGIEKADSVTFDAHKQLYVPVGAGIALFKDNESLNLIQHHAEYIIRKGSRDLGRKTLEGSRPGMALLIHSGLHIIGRGGYEMLINMGIEKAQAFAQLIKEQDDFELVTEPELNLLTYRYIPESMDPRSQESKDKVIEINNKLNELTVSIQKEQRDSGKTFVSRTTLEPLRYQGQKITVFRVVLANPLTRIDVLNEILEEQRKISKKFL